MAIPRRRPQALRLLGFAVAAVLMIAIGARMHQVHAYGWEWTVFPSAAPPKVHFEGRDYTRGIGQPRGVPRDYARAGQTLGGGEIYDHESRRQYASTVIYVRDADDVYAYGLMGGP